MRNQSRKKYVVRWSTRKKEGGKEREEIRREEILYLDNEAKEMKTSIIKNRCKNFMKLEGAQREEMFEGGKELYIWKQSKGG